MSYILLFMLTICTIQIIGVIFTNTIYRKYLPSMHGMLLSMSLGMLSGLLFGTVLGVLLNGDLFTSTILSILIGLSIGFLAGLPFHLTAVIEGSISGLMGGMMGAMLGDMIPMSNPETLIKLMVYYTMMLLFLISYFTEASINKELKNSFSISKHPYIYIIVLTLLFFYLKDVSIITIENRHHHSF